MKTDSLIPYSKQALNSEDITAVCDVLQSDWITQGPLIARFERAIAKYCGSKYAVAVSSGSAALHLGAMVLGWDKGDEVITTPISFLATANAILHVGAQPIFSDIDSHTVNLDPSALKKRITKKTKAIITVDFAGLPGALEEIKSIADHHGLAVFEDASHALGAMYKRHKIGSCRYSDMTVFSFHPVKHITTGEGGCITTNNRKIYDKLLALRSHGVYREPENSKTHGGWYYEMKDLGFNYRITDFQCALGLSQFKRLDALIGERTQIAERYNQAFSKYDNVLKVPARGNDDLKHSWHLYVLRLRNSNYASDRRSLYDYLVSKNIKPQVHYIPIYQQPYYKRLNIEGALDCPRAEEYYSGALSLPIYPGLEVREQNRVIDSVKQFLTSRLNQSRLAQATS